MAEDSDEQKTIISLFAHPDDELGAIGVLANHAERGDNVILAWTTSGELTTLFPDLHEDEIKRERVRHTEEIRKIVGAQSTHIFDFGDSMVSNSREQRVEVAKFYAQHKPDVVVSWGVFNSHSDHRATGQLALEAIQFARINKIVEQEPHRKNVKLLSYYEKQYGFPVKYIDVTDNLNTIIEVADFYAEIYGWKNVHKWINNSRTANGMEAGCEFAEKYNVRFEYHRPTKYAI